MKKLVQGIVEFRKNALPEYREKFAKLALGQSPDSLFIACSDSRVVPNTFASTDPGDLFVIRNVGNLIPCCGEDGHSLADESEAAAIEFAVLNLKIKDIIVCGHSECGAMNAILNDRNQVQAPHLKAWLRHGDPSLTRLQNKSTTELKTDGLSPLNRLTQLNVLEQIKHLLTYPLIRERYTRGELKIHGWWFELTSACVYAYEQDQNRFVLIDEAEAENILKRV